MADQQQQPQPQQPRGRQRDAPPHPNYKPLSSFPPSVDLYPSFSYSSSSSLHPSSRVSRERTGPAPSSTRTATTTPTAAATSHDPGTIGSEAPPPRPPYPAIIVPLVGLFVAIVALIFYLRQRKRTHRQRAQEKQQFRPLAPGVVGGGDVRQGIYRSPSSPPRVHLDLPSMPPVILSSRTNHAYLTGLDTSSQGSNSNRNSRDLTDEYGPTHRRSIGGTTFLEPPPPYEPDDEQDGPLPRSEYSAVPQGDVLGSRSPFEDPEYEIRPASDRHSFLMQGRRRPFADVPGSPVSEMGSRTVLTRRTSDVSDL